MARHGVAVTAARMGLVDRLDTALERVAGVSPACGSGWSVRSPSGCVTRPQLVVEDWLREALAAARATDAAVGAAALGRASRRLGTDGCARAYRRGWPARASRRRCWSALILAHAGLIARGARLRADAAAGRAGRASGPGSAGGAVRCTGRDCRADDDHRNGCRGVSAARRPRQPGIGREMAG